MRKISKKGAKAKAWKSFARFIKARDANSKGMVSCCTCNKWMRWDEPDCQAGHFIGGRKNAVLFDEMGVHGQCSGCNMTGGEQFLYGLFMKRKYNMTDEQLEAMRAEARKPRQYKLYDYIRIAEEYQSKGDEIVASKGL